MKHRIRRQILYILLLILDKIVLLLPIGVSLAIGRFLGFIAYLFLPKYTRITKENLKAAFKDEKSQQQINRIALDVFKNLGMNAAEVLSMPKISKQIDKKVCAVGFEKIDRALSKGKGAIILSAHFGNWELLPAYFVAKGYPSNVVARHVYFEKYDEWVALLRKSTGVNIIFRDESPRKIVEVLKSNELLGIMPDQDIDSIEGIFVNFFGRPAYTPIAPVALSMKMDCPILPCFIIRENAKHKIVIEDPVKLQITDNKDEDLVKNTQTWSNIIESYIRRYPEHWVWVHRRWKTRPK
jgi:Kdo2-lipid IVA lauroyltransferase/acyltransferase